MTTDKTFSIIASNNNMGSYQALSASQALDKYARDRGCLNFNAALELGDDARAIQIDINALKNAVKASTGYEVFEPNERGLADGIGVGTGVCVYDSNVWDSWDQVAESIGKNCWDFKA